MIDQWRKDVVTEAMTWLGTPYHHLAAVKRHGVDCAMILVRVFGDLKLIPCVDPRPYSPQWFLHQDEEIYLSWVEKYFVRVEKAQPADLALYRLGRCAAHGAIVIDDDYMIHAYMPSRCVEIRERRAALAHGKLDSLWTLKEPPL